MSHRLKIWLAILFLYIVWGSAYLAIHFLVESVPPILASGLRNFAAGVLLFVGAYFRKDFVFPSLKAWLWMGLVGFLMLAIGNGCLTVAVQWVPSGYAALMTAMIPVWLVLLQWMWGTKKPSLLVILGCMLGLVGVGLLLNSQQLALKGYESYFIYGFFLLLIATIAWSFGVMVATQKVFQYPIIVIAAIQMIVGGAILLIFSGLYGEWNGFTWQQVKPEAYESFLFLLFFASILGFSVFNWVSQQASPTLVATYNFVNPLVAIALGSLFANEPINQQIIIASVLIIGAVILITRE